MTERRKVTLIPGDGIGPEVMSATVRVLEALQVPLEFEHGDAGSEVISKYGTNLPRETLDSVLRNGVALKGPTGTQIGAGLPRRTSPSARDWTSMPRSARCGRCRT